jgi:3-methyl-2-oxobutanoate hydroxymethyltransferase
MRITVNQIREMKQKKEKIAMLTAYDYSLAKLVEEAGVPLILVGDSLGMVVLGYESTIPVTIDEMIHHTKAVVRATQKVLVVGDMPFMTYQIDASQALRNAARFIQDGGAQAVKLEGGVAVAETVKRIVDCGIPVMGHLGLTPQSVHQLGGYRVQGKTEDSARRLVEDAKLLAQAGASALVLECVPAGVGKQITDASAIITLGIGGGPHCSGQILNLYDMLDAYPGKKARFVKNFMAGAASIQEAVSNFMKEVKAGTFPGPEHCF